MNVADLKACRHEAIHVCAALAVGWPVRGVIRRADASGSSHLTPLTDGDLGERAIEAGVVLFAPALDGCSGTEVDLALLGKLLDSGGASLLGIWDRTAELLSDREFQRRVRVVESELYSRPVMSGDEVAQLLEDSAEGLRAGRG